MALRRATSRARCPGPLSAGRVSCRARPPRARREDRSPRVAVVEVPTEHEIPVLARSSSPRAERDDSGAGRDADQDQVRDVFRSCRRLSHSRLQVADFGLRISCRQAPRPCRRLAWRSGSSARSTSSPRIGRSRSEVAGSRRCSRFSRCSPGEVVPVGRLIEELWPEGPPDSALNTLQAYVSRLRKALRGMPGCEGEAILFEHGGYRLDVPKDEIDSHRFARLIEEGEHQAHAGDAEEPALLPRGARSVARAGARRLRPRAVRAGGDRPPRGTRLAAIEARIDADLECGRQAAWFPSWRRSSRSTPPRRLPSAAHARALPLGAVRATRSRSIRTHGRRSTPSSESSRRPGYASSSRRSCARTRRSVRRSGRGSRPSGAPAGALASGRASRRSVLAIVAAGVLLRPSHGSAAVQSSGTRSRSSTRRRTRSSTTSSSATTRPRCRGQRVGLGREHRRQHGDRDPRRHAGGGVSRRAPSARSTSRQRGRALDRERHRLRDSAAHGRRDGRTQRPRRGST